MEFLTCNIFVGIHAREWISPAVVMWMVMQLTDGLEADLENSELLV